MEKITYGQLGKKVNKIFHSTRETELLTLKDFVENKWVIHSSQELKLALIREMKRLLRKDTVENLIQGFFDLEADYSDAKEKVSFEDDINFDEFYKNFSPLIMRAILESQKTHQDDEHFLINSIKESMRIAIEGAIYQIEDEDSV